VVRGTVVGVQDFGLFIKLSETIKALCPLWHLTDVSRSKISTKFEVMPAKLLYESDRGAISLSGFWTIEPRISLVPPE
jgi:DNA-directed RNA polymerase subunit E'/Rpb7